MKQNSFSRRAFFHRSLGLVSIPLTLMSADFKKSKQSDTSSPQDVPDKARIFDLLKEKKNPLIWLFTGDSITHGAKHTHGFRSYPEVFAERIRWELGRVRDVIINTGISGNTTQTILGDFDWRVKQFKPHVVSLMIGTNDCAKDRVAIKDFENNLFSLVKRFRESDAIPVLHTPNIIIAEKDPSRSRLPEYVSVIREVAAKERVILIDNYQYWQQTLQSNSGAKVYRDWLNDPLHPDGEGHLEIARLMFRELSIFDPAASTCGAPYYEGEH
jgi:acyl-CoA thioesterase I